VPEVVLRKLSVGLQGAIVALGLLVAAAPAQAIVGGREVTETYPFLAHLSTGCGAVLIKSDWVVTAGHCVPAGNPRISVRVGSRNKNSGGTSRQAVQAYVHRGVDFALLRLESPVSQAPVVIASSPPLINNVVRVIGWGQTCANCGGTTVARERDTVVTFENRCSPGGIDGVNELCTTAAACFGDSGGPMVRSPDVDGNWFLHGVVRGGDNADCAVGHTIGIDLAIQRATIGAVVGGLPT
jgi:snapalysin